MNALLSTFPNWVISIAAIIAAICTIGVIVQLSIRVVFEFNLNQWLNDRRNNRRKQQKGELRRLCPHVELDFDGESIHARGIFIPANGGIQYRCIKCGYPVYARKEIECFTQYWMNHPIEWIDRIEEMAKIARKLGGLAK